MNAIDRVEYSKPPLTFEAQLQKLQERGMVIGDPLAAVRALTQISYYRLSAYWYPFRVAADNDRFQSGTTFDAAVRLYDYDRRLRLQMVAGIERVEVVTRTAMTYVLAHAFGSFAHAEAESFRDGFEHAAWCSQLDDEVRKVRVQFAFLEHFEKRYHGFPRVPIWMATEVLTFGRLSKLVRSGLRDSERIKVADHLGVHASLISSWMQSLTTVRNICAHHGRLWNRHMGTSPKLPKGHPAWEGTHKSRVFASILMVRRLLSTIDDGAWWAAMVPLLDEADASMRAAMSIPSDWKSRPPP